MWARLLSFGLGLWLMAAPAVLGYDNPARDAGRIVGPIIAGCAFIAIWQVTRFLRWVTLPAGAWLVVAPWVLGGYPGAAMWNSVLVGLVVVGTAFVEGEFTDRFGGGWRSLWKREQDTA